MDADVKILDSSEKISTQDDPQIAALHSYDGSRESNLTLACDDHPIDILHACIDSYEPTLIPARSDRTMAALRTHSDSCESTLPQSFSPSLYLGWCLVTEDWPVGDPAFDTSSSESNPSKIYSREEYRRKFSEYLNDSRAYKELSSYVLEENISETFFCDKACAARKNDKYSNQFTSSMEMDGGLCELVQNLNLAVDDDSRLPQQTGSPETGLMIPDFAVQYCDDGLDLFGSRCDEEMESCASNVKCWGSPKRQDSCSNGTLRNSFGNEEVGYDSSTRTSGSFIPCHSEMNEVNTSLRPDCSRSSSTAVASQISNTYPFDQTHSSSFLDSTTEIKSSIDGTLAERDRCSTQHFFSCTNVNCGVCDTRNSSIGLCNNSINTSTGPSAAQQPHPRKSGTRQNTKQTKKPVDNSLLGKTQQPSNTEKRDENFVNGASKKEASADPADESNSPAKSTERQIPERLRDRLASRYNDRPKGRSRVHRPPKGQPKSVGLHSAAMPENDRDRRAEIVAGTRGWIAYIKKTAGVLYRDVWNIVSNVFKIILGLILVELEWLARRIWTIIFRVYLIVTGWSVLARFYSKLASGMRRLLRRPASNQNNRASDSFDFASQWRNLNQPETLAENIQLPETGEEAMKRLFAGLGKDPYSVLGLRSDCTDEEIRKYYRRQAILVHPDKNREPGADEAFKILSQAFEMIGEPDKRREYDAQSAKERQADAAMNVFADLLTKLQERMKEALDLIPCEACHGKHRRVFVDRSIFSARYCSRCKIQHPVREGDIWAESRYLGFLWRYYACMDGQVYDITKWASCQVDSFRHIKSNAHQVTMRMSTNRGGVNTSNPTSPPNVDEFLNSVLRASGLNSDFSQFGAATPGAPPAASQPNNAESSGKRKKKKRR